MKTIKLEDGRKVNVVTSAEHNSVISPNILKWTNVLNRRYGLPSKKQSSVKNRSPCMIKS